MCRSRTWTNQMMIAWRKYFASFFLFRFFCFSLHSFVAWFAFTFRFWLSHTRWPSHQREKIYYVNVNICLHVCKKNWQSKVRDIGAAASILNCAMVSRPMSESRRRSKAPSAEDTLTQNVFEMDFVKCVVSRYGRRAMNTNAYGMIEIYCFL